MLYSDFIAIHGKPAWTALVKPILDSENPPDKAEIYNLVHHQIIDPLIQRLNRKFQNRIRCICLVRAQQVLADDLTDLDWQNYFEDALDRYQQHSVAA